MFWIGFVCGVVLCVGVLIVLLAIGDFRWRSHDGGRGVGQQGKPGSHLSAD